MIRPAAALLLMLVACAAPPAGPDAFDQDFTGEVMRLDLFHTGHARQEQFRADSLRVEGPWPGPRWGLDQDLDLGSYRADVLDAATGRLLYRQGFASIFGEWRTTAEAGDGVERTFTEAIRFPEPRRPFVVVLSRRDARQEWQETWREAFDPAHPSVRRTPYEPRDVVVLEEHGPVERTVDLLLLGDGYTAAERTAFLEDARRLTEALFSVEPFRSRRGDFNVRAVFPRAAASGVTDPRAGRYLDSPLRTTYDVFGLERYALTLDDQAWRDVAASAPYDAVILLMNQDKYGGGGIYQLYCAAAARSAEAAYLVVHEFGHHFAALADEYYTSQVAYETAESAGVEPWEPNVTALLDPDRLKWRDLVTPGTPTPTPWPKAELERLSRDFRHRREQLRAAAAPESSVEVLFAEERRATDELLAGLRGVIGAFEGAMYQARGLFRPAIDCVMFSRNEGGFCPVCARAIERVIDASVGPAEDAAHASE